MSCFRDTLDHLFRHRAQPEHFVDSSLEGTIGSIFSVRGPADAGVVGSLPVLFSEGDVVVLGLLSLISVRVSSGPFQFLDFLFGTGLEFLFLTWVVIYRLIITLHLHIIGVLVVFRIVKTVL